MEEIKEMIETLNKRMDSVVGSVDKFNGRLDVIENSIQELKVKYFVDLIVIVNYRNTIVFIIFKSNLKVIQIKIINESYLQVPNPQNSFMIFRTIQKYNDLLFSQ